MIFSLVIVFLLQVFSNFINTLKTLFLIKGISKPAYILTFVDSITFAYGMKLTVGGESDKSLILLCVYALGKTIGSILGDYAEKRLALGTLEVIVNTKIDKAIKIADYLRDIGYTVTTKKIHGLDGKELFEVCIVIKRKEYEYLKQTLEKLEHRNTIVREVKDVTGKIRGINI